MTIKPLSPDSLTQCVVQLGSGFIKLAQVLATRADFFSQEYLDALKALHDNTPPMSQKDFEEVYLKAFEVTQPFESFNTTPIASASIGQVHEAKLFTGEKVAIKLKKAGIVKQVHADIKILKGINFLFRPLFSTQTKNSIEAVIVEFSSMILKEVDFSCELSNIQLFWKTYSNPRVSFPLPYPQYCSADAIVMSFEEGYRFDDKDKLNELGIDFKELMGDLVWFYTEQMLFKGIFHADPHPGNLLVRSDGSLVLLDFGMVKHISNKTRTAIIELVQSAHEKDFDLFISSARKLGIVAYEADDALLALFAQRMFEIFGDESLSAASMQLLGFSMLESLQDLPFKLPQEAVYISRVSSIIEGLGTSYVENFNGIKDILPLLQANLSKALGHEGKVWDTIKKEVINLPWTLQNFSSSLSMLKEGNIRVHLHPDQINALTDKLTNKIKKTLLVLLSSSIGFVLWESSSPIAICLWIVAAITILTL